MVWSADSFDKKLTLVAGIVNKRGFAYSETCPKQKIGVMETCLQGKTFTVLRIWSTEHPNFNYLYDTEPACNRKKFCPLQFCDWQVSLY
jgi:hypothetical protein